MDDIVIGWNLGNSPDSNTRENEGLAADTISSKPEAKGGTYVVDTEKLSQESENANLCADEDYRSVNIIVEKRGKDTGLDVEPGGF